MARKKRKWKPICSWCRMDLEGPAEDWPWRTPMYGAKDAYAEGLLAGVVVCSPDCPERPDGVEVYKKRPSVDLLKHMTDSERELAIAGTL